MTNDSGYAGWVNLPLDASEEADLKDCQQKIQHALEVFGYPQDVRDNLKVAFTKASLTIDGIEARSGAGHQLADGQPFYRLEIAANGKTLEDGMRNDKTVATLMMLFQMLGQAGMSMGNPIKIDHDFRGSIQEKRRDLVKMLGVAAPYVMKSPGGPQPG
ncbi:MAG: hypothetical protein KKA05_08820 [Alphaproteobacteria bacterium]|nr:hypothetical protein [Alphaproteobacteria bacterium]MBU0858662.1 hypothetical protein [Alphaproteobacteria bacterium]